MKLPLPPLYGRPQPNFDYASDATKEAVIAEYTDGDHINVYDQLQALTRTTRGSERERQIVETLRRCGDLYEATVTDRMRGIS